MDFFTAFSILDVSMELLVVNTFFTAAVNFSFSSFFFLFHIIKVASYVPLNIIQYFKKFVSSTHSRNIFTIRIYDIFILPFSPK